MSAEVVWAPDEDADQALLMAAGLVVDNQDYLPTNVVLLAEYVDGDGEVQTITRATSRSTPATLVGLMQIGLHDALNGGNED